MKKTEDWANFILRRIHSDGVETDTMIGGFYSYIEKAKSPEVFKAKTKEWSEDELKDCYAIITFFDTSFMPLYEGSNYYIMTDTGGTVSNRTKR